MVNKNIVIIRWSYGFWNHDFWNESKKLGRSTKYQVSTTILGREINFQSFGNFDYPAPFAANWRKLNFLFPKLYSHCLNVSITEEQTPIVAGITTWTVSSRQQYKLKLELSSTVMQRKVDMYGVLTRTTLLHLIFYLLFVLNTCLVRFL